MENLEISHDILLEGSDFESCRKRVIHFFEKSMLIRYDEILIIDTESINGPEKEFSPRLNDGIEANQKVIKELLLNLKDEGFKTLGDLQGVEKGYVSKTFHTIAHLLDGFIGIDSRFYNLEEDSHTITKDMRQRILVDPQKYWILSVKGRIASGSEDPLDALRTFERQGKEKD